MNPAITYFRAEHYHRRQLLDDRVRDGNGYGQLPMVTGNAGRLGALDQEVLRRPAVGWRDGVVMRGIHGSLVPTPEGIGPRRPEH